MHNSDETEEFSSAGSGTVVESEFLKQKQGAQLTNSEVPQRRFGVTLGAYNLLLAPGLYSEFITQLELSPLPNSGSLMQGLINVRGNIVPVYDISVIVDETSKRSNTALLIGRPEHGAALLTASKPRAIQVSPEQRVLPSSSLPPALDACCDGAYVIDQEHWLSLNHDVLFSTLARSGSFDQLVNNNTISATIQ